MNQIFLCGRINRKITYTSYANGKEQAKSELVVIENDRQDFIPFRVDSNYQCFNELKKYNINDFIGLKGSLRYDKGRLYVEVNKITDLRGINE